jgi:hypothetical protein
MLIPSQELVDNSQMGRLSVQRADKRVVSIFPFIPRSRFLGPLTWGVGACDLRAQWISTSAARTSSISYLRISRSCIITPHTFRIIKSAQRSPYERPRLTESVRSAAGRRISGQFRKHNQAAARSLLSPALALFECIPLVWHSETSNLTLEKAKFNFFYPPTAGRGRS